jgi:imidazolonepropionase-like amidohydrolase
MAPIAFLLTALAGPVAAPQDHECGAPGTVVESVRVFDGERVVPTATVYFHCSTIAGVFEGGSPVEVPQDTIRIDGRGRTLLPGLIDAHVHTEDRAALERTLDFGVTTVLDMGSAVDGFVRSIREEDEREPATDRADLFSAVLWVTAPDSHGTQFGEVPTLVEPEDAASFVAARISDGADFIKIIYDNFKMFDRPVPTLSKATMFATVRAAHDRGKLAVVHSRDVEAIADVVEAGADGLVHLPVDEVPSDELVQALADKGMFVMPNLCLARHEGLRLIEDPLLGPTLTDNEVQNLRQWRSKRREFGDEVEYAALIAFHDAGVTVLAGSDAPNGGAIAGGTLHMELELLVEAGLRPLEALRSATSKTASTFGLTDRGRISEGLLADLVLVDGAPDQDITDTRRIVAIWKREQRHPR